jgi:protein phosphatase 1D
MGHPCTAGTTTALVIIRGNKLYVAHFGDSTVIMGVQRDEDAPLETMALAEDHEPEA